MVKSKLKAGKEQTTLSEVGDRHYNAAQEGTHQAARRPPMSTTLKVRYFARKTLTKMQPLTPSSPADSVTLATSTSAADAAIACLTAQKTAWTQVSIADRITYLNRCITRVMAIAEPWATAACHAKGIDPSSSLAGEEWLVGPAAVLTNLQALVKTLTAEGQPQPVAMATRADGQQVVQVFPHSLMERLMWAGFRAELWLEPGKPATQGKSYREPPRPGHVALVLGAGNVSAIAPMDVLYKLFAENQVVLLKMNPVNEYMGPILEQALQPLIADGFLAIAYGGAELGNYLCHHASIDSVHITGSHHTHDAIVWGSTAEERAQRQIAHDPLLKKPITSELGCVTPILVVPGRWSAADIQFQARHVAGMVAHNASFNCVAGKVLVLASGWAQRQQFLEAVHAELAKTPARRAYYPGAQQRYQAFLDQYPQAIPLIPQADDIVPWTIIPDVPAQANEYALTTEAFCGVLAEVTLDAADAAAFLAAAVDFANHVVWGTLACTVLVHPSTRRQFAAELEQAIAQLRYGNIGINLWAAVNFSISSLPWGAFPGNSLEDIGSGSGSVHNTLLFDHPQKSVVYAPFRIAPTPLWFADHPNRLNVARRLTTLQGTLTWGDFLKFLLEAVRS